MTKETINFLWDILEVKNLSDGAKLIIRNILKMDSLNIKDSTNLFKNIDKKEKPRFDNIQYVDYRMTNMTLQGFRTFPEAEKPYGINLTDENNMPSSLILIGSNGTGKSSLFSAVELYYTGISSLAQERHVDQERFLRYGLKGEEKLAEPLHAKIVSLVGDVKLNNLATPSSFCSNYDIQKLEENSDDLTDYILQQLGYGDILIIDSMLESERKKAEDLLSRSEDAEDELSITMDEVINAYIDLSLNRRGGKEENQDRFTSEKAIEGELPKITKDNLKKKVFIEDWKQLLSLQEEYLQMKKVLSIDPTRQTTEKNEELVNSLSILAKKYGLLFSYFNKKSSEKERKSNLKELYNRYYKAKEQEADELMTKEKRELRNKDMEQRVKDIDDVKSTITTFKQSILSEFIIEFKQFVESILTDFSELDTFTLKTDNRVYVSIDVKDYQGNSFSAKPNEYLNSFRFVLYCVSLKLALAFWQMKKNKTITPVVIDDVFDASDFENSLKLEKFVYEIFRAYAMMAGKEGIIIPLQLIVLTHDQLMKTSFERGLARYKIESSIEERKLMKPASCICGRLLPVKEVSKATNEGLIQAYDSFINLYIQL